MALNLYSSYDDITNYFKNQYAADLQAAKDKSNELYKGKYDTTKGLYESQINELGAQYVDLERQNAIQKFINEREVAETNANLGLTDSGLNRTQQTAIQLSHANNSAKYARERQAMENSLVREMTAALAKIESDRLQAEYSIDQDYSGRVASSAQEVYKANQEAITKQTEKAANTYHGLSKSDYDKVTTALNSGDLFTADRILSAELASEEDKYWWSVLFNIAEDNIGFYNYTNKKTDDGKLIFTNNLGTVEVEEGRNPYTNAFNANGASDDTSRAYTAYGAFDNGYQPKGVFYQGVDFGEIKWDKTAGDEGYTTITGKKQKVWKTPDKQRWYWDGKKNMYLPFG